MRTCWRIYLLHSSWLNTRCSKVSRNILNVLQRHMKRWEVNVKLVLLNPHEWDLYHESHSKHTSRQTVCQLKLENEKVQQSSGNKEPCLCFCVRVSSALVRDCLEDDAWRLSPKSYWELGSVSSFFLWNLKVLQFSVKRELHAASGSIRSGSGLFTEVV